MQNLIRSLAESGIPLIIVSHDRALIALCDTVLLFEKGTARLLDAGAFLRKWRKRDICGNCSRFRPSAGRSSRCSPRNPFPLLGIYILSLDLIPVRFGVMPLSLLGATVGLIFGVDPVFFAIVFSVAAALPLPA